LNVSVVPVDVGGVVPWFGVVNGSFVVDFLPELNLSYHVVNSFSCFLNVSDGVNDVVSNVFTVSYSPFLRALLISVEDLYNGSSILVGNVSSGSAVDFLVDGDRVLFFFNMSEYFTVYSINMSGYYFSFRYFPLDSFNNFRRTTLVPVNASVDGVEGDIEGGFLQAFHTPGQGDSPDVDIWGTIRYMHVPKIFVCVNDSWTNTTITPEMVDMFFESLSYFGNATNGFIVPGVNTPVIVERTLEECDNVSAHYGNLGFYWDHNSLGAGANSHTTNGHVIIESNALVNNQYCHQSTYNQELFQALGVPADQFVFGPSTYSDHGNPYGDTLVPTVVDLALLRRVYERQPCNHFHDVDYVPPVGGDVFSEVRRFVVRDVLVGGVVRRLRTTELLGYYFFGEVPPSLDGVFRVLPVGARLLRSDVSGYVEVLGSVDGGGLVGLV